MFEVFNERTGVVVRRVRDALRANEIAISYTETYAFINGDTFDTRTEKEPERATLRSCAPSGVRHG